MTDRLESSGLEAAIPPAEQPAASEEHQQQQQQTSADVRLSAVTPSPPSNHSTTDTTAPMDAEDDEPLSNSQQPAVLDSDAEPRRIVEGTSAVASEMQQQQVESLSFSGQGGESLAAAAATTTTTTLHEDTPVLASGTEPRRIVVEGESSSSSAADALEPQQQPAESTLASLSNGQSGGAAAGLGAALDEEEHNEDVIMMGLDDQRRSETAAAAAAADFLPREPQQPQEPAVATTGLKQPESSQQQQQQQESTTTPSVMSDSSSSSSSDDIVEILDDDDDDDDDLAVAPAKTHATSDHHADAAAGGGGGMVELTNGAGSVPPPLPNGENTMGSLTTTNSHESSLETPAQLQPAVAANNRDDAATNGVDSRTTAPQQQSQPKPPPPPGPPRPPKRAPEVIDLLDSDDDEDDSNNAAAKRQKIEPAAGALASYQRRGDHLPSWYKGPPPASSSSSRTAASTRITPGASLPSQPPPPVMYTATRPPPGAMPPPPGTRMLLPPSLPPPRAGTTIQFDTPFSLPYPPGFTPTWEELYPPPPPPPTIAAPRSTERKAFRLSLLNCHEFTIEGLSVSMEGPPTSTNGLRSAIKKASRDQGKAVYERDEERGGGGKWRIPLGAYHSFFAYLQSQPLTFVEPIPQHQLQIASLERARQERGYPEAASLVQQGLPEGLAKALAPFQRGGVDFVVNKGGRALIADDMGLGKTIQGIASMAMYRDEWPLLVLCPSGARYHWENEFRNWLGVDSRVNNMKDDDKETKKESGDGDSSTTAAKTTNGDKDSLAATGTTPINGDGKVGDIAVTKSMNGDKNSQQSVAAARPNGMSSTDNLLKDSQIHVLKSSKEEIFPSKATRVVICSYGLVTVLVESGKLQPRMFPCAIVDESHMLKSKTSKRTTSLMPILTSTKRCVLLSGTPALARPAELWPQLQIVGTQKHGWWDDEAEFMDKYGKPGETRRLAELHTLLTGTIMIRRLKADILKTMPSKIREKAGLHVLSHEQRDEFKDLMAQLREGKGALGQLAREEHKATPADYSGKETDEAASALNDASKKTMGQACAGLCAPEDPLTNGENIRALEEAKKALNDRIHQEFQEGRSRIQNSLISHAPQLSVDAYSDLAMRLEENLRKDLEKKQRDEMQTILSRFGPAGQKGPSGLPEEQENKRVSLLSRLYELSGKAKIPLMVDMLKRWLNDPLSGKLCIFAHHISVLDSLRELAGLCNDEGSNTKFIRIDGSTSPKKRQEQINSFQTDPSVRIALLGITAAGVAVTLTASSTVWFAELFWTPAIMIQAEDRCHRIGQQARVRCLYFVARGTLDDILWRLLEKKFSDLGEFVEGQEKLKIVVDKTYHKVSELHEMFSPIEQDDEEDGDGFDPFPDFGDDEDLQLDPDLFRDIEELGEEERRMLLSSDTTEEDAPAPGSSEEKAFTILDDDEPVANAGRSEEDAIALSDDEEDTNTKSAEDGSSAVAVARAETNGGATPAASAPPTAEGSLLSSLSNFRIYRMYFQGPKLGLEVRLRQGRMIVAGVSKERTDRVGTTAKPSVGDVVCAVNGVKMPRMNNIQAAMNMIRHGLSQGVVMLDFAEDPTFAAYYMQVLAREAEQKQQQSQQKQQQQPPAPPQIPVSDQGPASSPPSVPPPPVAAAAPRVEEIIEID